MGILNSRVSRPSRLLPASLSKDTLGPPINNFLGCHNSANKINQPFGQLVQNKNMEYLRSGDNVYLKSKRGSSLILDITSRPYGAALYTYNRATEYFVWVDSSSLKQCETDGANMATVTSGDGVLTANQQTYFVMYGQDTSAALYGCNGTTDNVFKVSGSTPTYSAVANSPQLSHMSYSTLAGRLIGVYGHTFYFTKVQAATGVTNLEDWDLSNNTAIVSPDSGSGFNYVQDLGVNGVYLWKDTGIWVLPNINEAQANWRFPRCKSDVGTLSPKTIHSVNYGGVSSIVFLAPDKTLRLFNPQLQYNAGSIPSVVNSDAKVISEPFQKILNEISDGQLSKCTAKYFDRLYILNIPSEGAADITRTIFIDTEKLLPAEGDKIPQPYWFDSENMDFVEFALKVSTHKLYGFNKQGYISQLLVENKYYEEMPTRISVSQAYEDSGSTRKVAIEYNAYTAWIDFSNIMARGQKLELIRGYLYWETDGDWNTNISVNAALRGDTLPDYDLGLNAVLTPNLEVLGGIFDLSFFGESYFASLNASVSQNIRVRNKGHYFLFGVYGTGYDEPVTIYGIEPIFKAQKQSPAGIR